MQCTALPWKAETAATDEAAETPGQGSNPPGSGSSPAASPSKRRQEHSPAYVSSPFDGSFAYIEVRQSSAGLAVRACANSKTGQAAPPAKNYPAATAFRRIGLCTQACGDGRAGFPGSACCSEGSSVQTEEPVPAGGQEASWQMVEDQSIFAPQASRLAPEGALFGAGLPPEDQRTPTQSALGPPTYPPEQRDFCAQCCVHSIQTALCSSAWVLRRFSCSARHAADGLAPCRPAGSSPGCGMAIEGRVCRCGCSSQHLHSSSSQGHASATAPGCAPG